MVLKLYNKYLLFNKTTALNLHRYTWRSLSSRSAEAIFLEKSLEEPMIVVTEKQNVDVIGPPDPVSNLRPVIRKRMLYESPSARNLRDLQDETEEWNQKFWASHNTNFQKERNEFIKQHLKLTADKTTLTADEMSEFYKSFLDKNWKNHVTYNMEWYKRNFRILFMALRVNVESIARSS